MLGGPTCPSASWASGLQKDRLPISHWLIPAGSMMLQARPACAVNDGMHTSFEGIQSEVLSCNRFTGSDCVTFSLLFSSDQAEATERAAHSHL